MAARMTYRDYLIWTASNVIASLSEAIRMATDMDNEYSAVFVLESRLDVVRVLAEYKHPNPDVVGPRPVADKE